MRVGRIITRGERLFLHASFASFTARAESKIKKLFSRRSGGNGAATVDRAGEPPRGQLPWLPLVEPSITHREAALLEALGDGWHGEAHIRRFENEIAAYLGVRRALATSSCTGAMHLALRALCVGPGDEVIVPEITTIATAAAVTYCGATPIIADVDPRSWCLDPQRHSPRDHE